MKWQGRKKSSNVKDLRGSNPFGNSYRGTYGRKRIPIPTNRTGRSSGSGGSGLGCGAIILLLIVFLIFGGGSLLSGGGSGIDIPSPTPTENYSEVNNNEDYATTEDQLFDFVSVVLADTEVLWSDIFEENGVTYTEPEMIIFEDSVQSACGAQSSAVGPFYCPADETVYIDLNFYDQLVSEYGGGGDFAMGYVVAHEVGHHVQNLLGISDQVQSQARFQTQTDQNEMTVRMELQADYMAGVWGNYVEDNGWLEDGDIEEGLTAAYNIGDDVLQERAYGRVMPDSFTHGTAEQRQGWFMKGFESGDLSQSDTFNISYDDL